MSDYVFTPPAGWEKYTPAQKITYFNQNSITPEMLTSEGVSAADIAWMQARGYTGKPASAFVIPKESIAAETPAAGGAIPLVLAVAAAYFLGA